MQRQENTCKLIRYGGGRSHERTRLRLRSFPVQRENRATFHHAHLPFTMPEQSASSRIENLLDRLPSFLRPTRNVSNERMLLEAPVSPAGVSYRNGLVGVTLPFSPSFDTSTAHHHGAGACPSSCCTKGTLTRRLHGAWNTHSC